MFSRLARTFSSGYFIFTKNKITARQRGYTLIEISIALVVLGILIGGALVPLQARYEQQEIVKAEAYLQKAKTAVLSYALQHKTRERMIEWGDGHPSTTVSTGRPYLPCPDVTDDGLEDRVTVLPSTLTVVTTSQLTVDMIGACQFNKGMIPWKTLGIDRYDPWGTHLTYRVDPSYSDELFGFDETFAPDIFDRRMTVTMTSGNPYLIRRESMHDAGAVICTGLMRGDSTATDCLDEPQTNLVAGIVVTTTGTITLHMREIPGYMDNAMTATVARGIVDGVAFVIISHGRNRFGGVGQRRNANDQLQCNHMPIDETDGASIAELVNAHYWDGDHPFRTEHRNCPGGTGIPNYIFENVFVRDPLSPTAGGSDDLLIWAGANEIIGFLLSGGALPIPHLEHLE